MSQALLLQTPADAWPHRLSLVATADDMATTGSLLRPQPLTVSIERIAGTATGGCVAAGKPVVELQPAPRLRVPIAPTQHALLPGLPRAQGCLSLVFNTDDASTVFRRVAGTPCSLPNAPPHAGHKCVEINTKVRTTHIRQLLTRDAAHTRRAAALAHGLAEALPRDAAPLVAEVRALVAMQPRDQLADRYLVQLRRPDPAGPGSMLALTQPARSSWSASSSRDDVGAHARSSADAAAGQAATAAAAPPATGDAGVTGTSGVCSQSETPVPAAASEIQPCSWAADSPASCVGTRAAAEAWNAEGGPPSGRWPKPDAARQQLLQAAAASDDDAACAKLTHWQPDVKFFLQDGPPRQSRLMLCFADWRLEQLFQPWRAAACSQVHQLLSVELLVLCPPHDAEAPVRSQSPSGRGFTRRLAACASLDPIHFHSIRRVKLQLQDDTRAVQIMAPLALLAGCCPPLQLWAGLAGAAQWAGHASLLLAYLLVRLALARGGATR